MQSIVVKWSGKEYPVELPEQETVASLKRALQQHTQVRGLGVFALRVVSSAAATAVGNRRDTETVLDPQPLNHLDTTHRRSTPSARSCWA